MGKLGKRGSREKNNHLDPIFKYCLCGAPLNGKLKCTDPDLENAYDMSEYGNRTIQLVRWYNYYWSLRDLLSGPTLDIGCFWGYGTEILSRLSFVVGVEKRRFWVYRAKRMFPKRSFIVADAQSLPFKSKCFNAVVAHGVIEDLERPNDLLNEITRILSKEGKTIIPFPNILDLGNILRRSTKISTKSMHVWEPTLNEMLEMVSKHGFKNIKTRSLLLRCFPVHVIPRIIRDTTLTAKLFLKLGCLSPRLARYIYFLLRLD